MLAATKSDSKTTNNSVAANLVKPKEHDKNGIDDIASFEAVGIQMKLTIGDPGDKYEQEADRVAVKVVSMPAPKPVQGKCADCEVPNESEGTVQKRPLAADITPWVQKQVERSEIPIAQRIGEEKEQPLLIKRFSPENDTPGASLESRLSNSKMAQQINTTNSTTHDLPFFGQSREVRSIKANARENGPLTDASPRFAHDFSRIPSHAKAPAKIQPKVMVSTLEDQDEQEADRVADQVMRMHEPRLQRTCACGGGCPKCRVEQFGRNHGLLQTRRVQARDAVKALAPPTVHDVLRSPGQPLDSATSAYFESRFGHDFSHVRVHNDAKASESARAMNALAYTVGGEVVFGEGQFRPGNGEGRRLLAHELTHVVQQSTTTPFPVSLGAARETMGVAQAMPELQIQRACREEIPDSTSECVGESGSLAEPFFRFRVGCDEFLNETERDNFNDLLARVVPGDVFQVRGFASDEGDFDVNHRLSCARALFAASELERRGAIITQRIAHGPQTGIRIAHGSQPGIRRDHRSVVVERVAVPGSETSVPGSVQTVSVAIFSFPGNSRNPFEDLTFANRVYADCRVQFQFVGGGTVTAPLLGSDGKLQHSGDCGTFSTEEGTLVAHAERTIGNSAKIWIFYLPDFEPQSDAMGLACALSDLSGTPATIAPVIYIAGDADPATLAHELGHLLIDTGDHHGIDNQFDTGNVMYAPGTLSGGVHITADASQCARVRSNLGRLL